MKRLLRPLVYGLAATVVLATVYLVYNPPFSTEPGPERPRYKPPAVDTRKLAPLVDREKKLSERVPPDLSARLTRVRAQKDVSALIAVVMDHDDADAVRNEALNLLRRSRVKGLTERLVRLLGDPKNSARFRSYCIQHLWMGLESAGKEERQKIIGVLRRSISDRHRSVRREALLALVRENDPLGKTTAVAWLTDPASADVRDLAIRCVKELELKEHIPEIRKHLHSPDEPARIAAIVALSQWKDQASRPAIEKSAASGSHRLRRAAKAALERMGGAGASH